MASTYTSNFELEKQGVGDNVGTWGDPTLNDNVIGRVDSAMGATTSIALVSSPVTLTQAQWRSKCIKVTGTISANIVVSLPLSVNSVGSATAVGGEIIFDNETTGAFTITVKTAATASTGVDIPQGFRSVLYSDTINVSYADDQSRSTVQTYAGNPNGNVAGTAGSTTTPASVLFDRTNSVWYVCTTAGVAAVAVWSALTGPVTPPQGYLTASSSSSSPVLTADSIGATSIYYTPYLGVFVPISNGTTFVPIQFTQLQLDLSASQAASGIYDAILFLDGTTLRIGFGPSWAAGTGGSVTPGSCARGTGAGGAAIQRVNGIWLNTAAMTVNNGASTYSVGALRGTVVGSVFIDTTQGQVTCHRSYGQSRKFGVWNFYNRLPITLKAGDPTGSWNYAGTAYRKSDDSVANSLSVLCGLPEEQVIAQFKQNIQFPNEGGAFIGVGWNSTTALSGFGAGVFGRGNYTASGTAEYDAAPFLGLATVTSLEKSGDGTTKTFFGTEASMLLTGIWRG